eukprot:365674_1
MITKTSLEMTHQLRSRTLDMTSIHNVNEREVEYFTRFENINSTLYDTVAIDFKVTIFIREFIYQFLHFLAVPIIFLVHGFKTGYVMNKTHGFFPICIPFHSSTAAGHIMWLGVALCNTLWVMQIFNGSYSEHGWGFELLFINAQMVFRVFACALKYAYITDSDLDNNLSSEQMNTAAIMLIFGWGFLNETTIKQCDYETKIRLGWRQDLKLKLISKKSDNFHIDIDKFIENAIKVTWVPTKFFLLQFVCCGVVAMVIVAIDFMLSDYDSTIDYIFFIAWALGVCPMTMANFSYLVVGLVDFVRLNQLLAVAATFIIPKYRRKLFYHNGVKIERLLKQSMSKLKLNNINGINEEIPFNNNDLLIDIKDIESLYNWLNIRRYFLEFGIIFRQRELIIFGVIMISWATLGIYALYQTVFVDEVILKNYVITAIAWSFLIMPTIFTVIVASKIQKNFKEEIEILQDRMLKFHFDAVAEMQMENESNIHNINNTNNHHTKHYSHYLRTVGLETVVNALRKDISKYSFKIFGIRIDQGIITLMIPCIIIFLNLSEKTYSKLMKK